MFNKILLYCRILVSYVNIILLYYYWALYKIIIINKYNSQICNSEKKKSKNNSK